MNKLHLLPTYVSKGDCYKTKLLPPLSNAKSEYLIRDSAEGINPLFSNMETYMSSHSHSFSSYFWIPS